MLARPEIFISATSKDLGSCRQLVRDALLTLGCVPVVQDHFPPGAGEVRAMLRERIAGCQAVLHIAGECYGFEPQERASNEPRRSYTQLEYDIARELKKPLYTFLCAPDFPYDAHDPEPEELRLLQEQHRVALTAGDQLYQPIKDTTELNLRVRELQTRVETLSRDLQKTRSWLGRGIAATLVALALIGSVLWFQHRREAQNEQKVVQVSDELDRYRQAVKALADNYGKDIEPGRKLTDEEKFDRALAAVAAQQKVGVGELKTWLALFVAQVRANPAADFYDKALADFAEKHFAEAAADATKSAEQFQAQREAAAREKRAAAEREAQAAEKERRSWTLAGDAEEAGGHFAASLEAYQKAFALTDKHREPLVWCGAASRYETALWRMGRNEEAEPLAKEALDQRTALLGAEHPDTLGSINNLAIVLYYKGDNAGAEALYRRCLAVQERTLGNEDPATLTSVNNLANVLDEKGDHAGAEALFRRSLDALERTLGAEHPTTLSSVNNLAVVLKAKGDYAGAEALYRRCLEARERTLGQEHPDTLQSVNNLANLLYAKRDYAGAEALDRRCLEARERTLGREHPDTLQSVNNLAGVLDDKGDHAQAEALFRRCLEAQEHTLGKEHPSTLISVNNLAGSLVARGDYAGAEALYLRAQTGMAHVFPPEHPYRLDIDYYFSLLRQKQNRLMDALPLAEGAAVGAAKTLPPDSSDRLRYEKNLADLRAKLASASPSPPPATVTTTR